MKFRRIEYKKYIKLRIIATLIDYGIYLFLFVVYVEFMGTENSDGAKEVKGLLAMPLFLFWFIYFVVLETVNQATPGHDICKLIIVKSTGARISLGDAFKRRVIDPIDIFCYGIPALICINKTPKFQRLGDLWADTVVVKKTDIIETDVQF